MIQKIYVIFQTIPIKESQVFYLHMYEIKVLVNCLK